MKSTEALKVVASLRSVLRGAGLELCDLDAGFKLELSALDDLRLTLKRQDGLQTAASLILNLDGSQRLSAALPVSRRARRAISAAGLTFALVQHGSQFEDRDGAGIIVDSGSASGDGEALFQESAFRAFHQYESWQHSYTPFDANLRDLMLGDQTVPTRLERTASSAAGFGLGVYDRDFRAFVNPHELRQGTELTAISEVTGSWLYSVFSRGSSQGETKVRDVFTILGHALDNVREHAFDELSRPKSLVTIGVAEVSREAMLRIQVLDNGVGIPGTLSRQIGLPEPDGVLASRLLERAVGLDAGDGPLLPWGRGQGLPAMRQLADDLHGQLHIMSANSGGSAVSIRCVGTRPSQAISDLLPVAGTVVTLWVPIDSISPSAIEPEGAGIGQQELDV